MSNIHVKKFDLHESRSLESNNSETIRRVEKRWAVDMTPYRRVPPKTNAFGDIFASIMQWMEQIYEYVRARPFFFATDVLVFCKHELSAR